MSLARSSVPVLLALLLAGAASTASGGGINLSWDDCGSFGSAQKSFACNTNTGAEHLIASVVPGVAMAALNGAECTLTIQTPSATLPDWWQRQSGGCNVFSTPSFDFNSTGLTSCIDAWQGNETGGSIFDYPAPGFGSDVGRIRTISAMAPDGIAVDAVHEVYIVRIIVLHTKSTGTGACAGCTQSACIVLQSVKLNGPGGVPSQTLSNPVLRQHAIWQDPALLVGCPGATPARDRTWGSVKTLYR